MSILTFLDSHSGYYWLAVSVSVAAALVLSLRPITADAVRSSLRDSWWAGAILVILCAGRWPTWLITRHFNDDESFLIAGAMSLRHDPVFWRSVDGGTAGPLNFYALLPVGSLLGGDDYLSARITAAILIGLALFFAYKTLSILFDQQLARVAVLPAAVVEALSIHPDFVHYSTELVAIALISAAFYLFVRRLLGRAIVWHNLLAGFLLGCLPFAKLQSAPIGALLGLGWLAFELRQCIRGERRWARPVALIVGTLTPVIFTASVLVSLHLIDYATFTYIENNVAYAAAEADTPLFALIGTFWASASLHSSLLIEWFLGSAAALALATPLRQGAPRTHWIPAVSVVGLLFISMFCVFAPHRAFLHYVQLCVVPWTLFVGCNVGWILGRVPTSAGTQRMAILGGMLLLSLGGVIRTRASYPVLGAGDYAYYQSNRQEAAAKEISRFTHRGESIGLWGWASELYVETGLRQAARRAVTSSEIFDGPYREKYRRVFLHDIESSPPPVFVDATGPGNYGFTHRAFSFEANFPTLASFIKTNYTLDKELDGKRIYVRNDRWLAVLKDLIFPQQK